MLDKIERDHMIVECNNFKKDLSPEWNLAESMYETKAERACGASAKAKVSVLRIDGPIGPIIRTRIVFEGQKEDLLSLAKYRMRMNDEIDIYKGMVKLVIDGKEKVVFVSLNVNKYYGYGWYMRRTAFDLNYLDFNGYYVNENGKIKKIEGRDYLGNETTRAIEHYFRGIEKQLRPQDEK